MSLVDEVTETPSKSNKRKMVEKSSLNANKKKKINKVQQAEDSDSEVDEEDQDETSCK